MVERESAKRFVMHSDGKKGLLVSDYPLPDVSTRITNILDLNNTAMDLQPRPPLFQHESQRNTHVHPCRSLPTSHESLLPRRIRRGRTPKSWGTGRVRNTSCNVIFTGRTRASRFHIRGDSSCLGAQQRDAACFREKVSGVEGWAA